MSDGVILVAGEALYDLVLDPSGGVRAHPGGGPFTTARTVARLEQPAAFLGRLSRDRLGTTLRRRLAGDGVALDAAVATDDPTTLALAEVDDEGGARYRFYERATSAPGLEPGAAIAALPPSVAILHVGSLGLALEPVATALEAVVERLAGSALVALDPNVREGVVADPGAYRARIGRVLARTDLVKVSEEDLAWLDPGRTPAAAARALLDRGPSAVLLTRGARGVLVVHADGEVDVPAAPARVIDTIGAGDAFGGGVLAWWRANDLRPADLARLEPVAEAARFAARVAARTCERPGAEPPLLRELALPA
jgi:fructokinase